MAPRRKRQRLSVDGTEAVTAIAEPEQPVDSTKQIAKEAEKQKNLQQRRSLFVRSLPKTTTTDDLTEHFSQSYPIKHALAVLDPATKQCKGYGFVTFADAEDAQRAIEEFNGSELQGKKIKVEIAEPRHRDVDSEVPGRKKSAPSAVATEAKAAREQQQRDAQQPAAKLILRNLPWSIKTPEDLALLFRSYGKVKHATLPKKPNGELSGFGFIVMRGRKNAEKALEGINGKEVDGRTLAVDWAVEKETWQTLQKATREGEEGNNEEEEKDESGSEAEDDDEEDLDSDLESEDGSDDDSDASDDDGGIEFQALENEEQLEKKRQRDACTLFIRNLPFSADDESLEEHFSQFGPVRYARIVIDHETERPRGTGFVCFVNESDTIECLKGVPKVKYVQKTLKKEYVTTTVTHSVLENEDADPTGHYTMDGRVLQISPAVNKDEAVRLTAEGAASRFSRDKDKRRLYLLSEGTISSDSPLYAQLAPSEITLREASAKQRKSLIQNNPSLHLSLTRLSIRNIPRSITSKDLKQLARQAVVGFAKDVKAGKRQKLSKEELKRGGDTMFEAEKIRKKKGVGIVKQAKIVFETHEGSKVSEDTGAGRSRGYGFIEYYTHRNALMALRWLNGHAVDYKVKDVQGKKASKESLEDRKKRLIVEFAIENANVVSRRSDRENKSRDGPKDKPKGEGDAGNSSVTNEGPSSSKKGNKKRKHGSDAGPASTGGKPGSSVTEKSDVKDEKLANRSRIIQKKRMARRTKRVGKA
jgi:nucleolar protein 4